MSEQGHNEEDHENDDEDLNESYKFIENQCNLSKLQLPNKNDLFDHVETVHEEYHRGMLEAIAEEEE